MMRLSRSRRGVARRLALLFTAAAISVLSTATADIVLDNVNTDLATGNVKKATSFVTPTRGSAHALTLSTYLTDAADLHYAAVPTGHAPLTANAIKNAAEQCAALLLDSESVAHTSDSVTGIQQHLHRRHDAALHSLSAPSSDATAQVTAVAASTVHVARAQNVERHVVGLQPNTSYDVYFVAEVSGSNGVFGPVQSVLRSTTHAEPPTLEDVTVRAANGSAAAVEVNATLSAPGRIYFAFVPSTEASGAMATAASTPPLTARHLTSLDVVRNRSLSELPSVFALHDAATWSDLTVHKHVSGLAPATLYDVLVLTEAIGDGEVRSDVARLLAAVRTHALPPDVVSVTCAPLDASAEALVVDFALRFNAHDVDRAERLASVSFIVHYEATRMDTTATPTHTATTNAAVDTDADSDVDATADIADDVVRGVFPFGNFSNIEHLREQLAEPQRGVITGLRNSTTYRVVLRAETSSSHGLVGAKRAAEPCTTHARAPQILSANVSAVNGSVHALAVVAELTRGANVHFLVAPRHAVSVRHHFRDATSSEYLVDLARRDDSDFVFGVVELETDTVDDSSDADSTTPYTTTFQINGLRDATAYTVVVMPETYASRGVFGQPFGHLLDAQTNENASDVVLRGVAPVDGSTSSVELAVEMTKPADVLYYCVDTALPLRASLDACHEANRTAFQPLARSAESAVGSSAVAFAVGNLTSDTSYFVSVFAESARRNGVLSAVSSPPLAVTTHKPAPAVKHMQAEPVAASTNHFIVSVATGEPCLVHFAVIEGLLAAVNTESLSSDDDDDSTSALTQLPSPLTIINDKWIWTGSPASTSDPAATAVPRRQAAFVSQGRVFAANTNASFVAATLKANTTYTVFATTETSRTGNASGVYGAVHAVRVTTFAAAPTIVKATVDPMPDRTDSVVLTANLSAPGIVHYVLSDVDFADPVVIRGDSGAVGTSSNDTAATAFQEPHVVRGSFIVRRDDIAMEIVNGTNESRPVEPHMFVANETVRELRAGTTYHTSLTTETLASGGVFGAFPPPILVTTHLPAPTLRTDALVVAPVRGSSTSLAIELALSRFGDVHYVLFFRGLVRDRSDDVLEKLQRQQRLLESSGDQSQPPSSPLFESSRTNTTTNATTTDAMWPPVASTFDLAHLDAAMLKRAHVDELGIGVWENGTIAVSRDDVLTGKRVAKTIAALPPNAIFDVCLVTETAGSDGVFDWHDSTAACHRVRTHADYSNQSMLLDDIAVSPVDAQTDAVRIEVHMAKLPNAPAKMFASLTDGDTDDSDATLFERFAVAAGRTPFFILADSKHAQRDFSSNAFTGSSSSSSYDRTRDRASRGFKLAAAGAHGVAAAGMLRNVTFENASHVVLTHEVRELHANNLYYLFVAFETSGSDGVFTTVNAPLRRGRDSTSDAKTPLNDGLEVMTHESAPTLTAFAVRPTFGNTSRVTLAFDIVCASCSEAIVHALVYPAACARPSIDVLAQFPVDPDREPDSVDSVDDDVDDVDDNVDSVGDSVDDSVERDCRAPLTRRRFVVDMGERDHKALSVEREVFDAQLRANMSYRVFVATETANSSGVVSDRFVATADVTTFAHAPAFTYVRVAPRNGSTTELVLEFALDRPGDVHFIAGVSDNAELNVTSPSNVSRKARPEKHAQRLPDYARDVVRLQRSVNVAHAHARHVVVLDYLTPGTRYDVFVVAESPDSNGVYGRVRTFRNVSTHARAPLLLAHAVLATPGKRANLTVGFRVDTPGAVHVSVVHVEHWPTMQHVAHGSDAFGNRLAMREQLVAQQSTIVDAPSGGNSDSDGWRELTLGVPRAGANYTVYIVTETASSDGVFGTVATHRNVAAHGEPPTALKLAAAPTDARVDALTVRVQLTAAGHVHYVVLPHRERRSEHRDASVARGVVDVLAKSSQAISEERVASQLTDRTAAEHEYEHEHFETEFVVSPLAEGTTFDLYFRCETLHSRGVLGAWTRFPISARTHGLPPDVLEELACAVEPPCDTIGREPCMRTPNVCGDCLEGFTGALGSSNEPCMRAEGSARSLKRSATIKISGVRVNRLATLEPESESPQEQHEPIQLEEQPEQEQEREATESHEALDRELKLQHAAAATEGALAPRQRSKPKPTNSPSSTEPPTTDDTAAAAAASFEDDAVAADSDAADDDAATRSDADAADEDDDTAVSTSELESMNGGSDDAIAIAVADDVSTSTIAAITRDGGVLACPPQSHIVAASGKCECVSGYTRNRVTDVCELAPESVTTSHLPSSERSRL